MGCASGDVGIYLTAITMGALGTGSGTGNKSAANGTLLEGTPDALAACRPAGPGPATNLGTNASTNAPAAG